MFDTLTHMLVAERTSTGNVEYLSTLSEIHVDPSCESDHELEKQTILFKQWVHI